MSRGWGKLGLHAGGFENPSEPDAVADVCLILEGAYPFIVGGVSHWTHALIRQLPDLKFHLLTIQPSGADLQPRDKPNVLTRNNDPTTPALSLTKN